MVSSNLSWSSGEKDAKGRPEMMRSHVLRPYGARYCFVDVAQSVQTVADGQRLRVASARMGFDSIAKNLDGSGRRRMISSVKTPVPGPNSIVSHARSPRTTRK